MPMVSVGATRAPIASPTPLETNSASRWSVPISPFGPCCSVEPIGMMMPRDARRYSSTSCQVHSASCMTILLLGGGILPPLVQAGKSRQPISGGTSSPDSPFAVHGLGAMLQQRKVEETMPTFTVKLVDCVNLQGTPPGLPPNVSAAVEGLLRTWFQRVLAAVHGQAHWDLQMGWH